jgi:hypothetical protein
MAKKTTEVNKSDKIRELLKANPKMKAGEVISTLAGKGISVNPALFYFVKGKMKGRKARKKQVKREVGKVTGTTANGNTLAIILKVKKLAAEVGGMGKLHSLVEVLS